jgi:hypothetical protein
MDSTTVTTLATAAPVPSRASRRRAGGGPRSWNWRLQVLPELGRRCHHCGRPARFLVQFQAIANRSGAITSRAHPLCLTHSNQVAARRPIENWPAFIVAVALANGHGGMARSTDWEGGSSMTKETGTFPTVTNETRRDPNG